MNQEGDFKPLLSVISSYITDVVSNVHPNVLSYLETVIDSYINQQITHSEACSIFVRYIGTFLPIDKASRILNTPSQPLLSLNEYPIEAQHFLLQKKTRPWTEIEDIRLLAGIHKYGLECWGTIAAFVGNSRTKAQCAQRWSRGLDPRIAKMQWTQEEDQKLLLQVRKFGVKAWTKVASEMGSRSDVQCRYRYRQLAAEINQKTSIKPLEVIPDPITTQKNEQTHSQSIIVPSVNSLLCSKNKLPPINIFVGNAQIMSTPVSK